MGDPSDPFAEDDAAGYPGGGTGAWGVHTHDGEYLPVAHAMPSEEELVQRSADPRSEVSEGQSSGDHASDVAPPSSHASAVPQPSVTLDVTNLAGHTLLPLVYTVEQRGELAVYVGGAKVGTSKILLLDVENSVLKDAKGLGGRLKKGYQKAIEPLYEMAEENGVRNNLLPVIERYKRGQRERSEEAAKLREDARRLRVLKQACQRVEQMRERDAGTRTPSPAGSRARTPPPSRAPVSAREPSSPRSRSPVTSAAGSIARPRPRVGASVRSGTPPRGPRATAPAAAPPPPPRAYPNYLAQLRSSSTSPSRARTQSRSPSRQARPDSPRTSQRRTGSGPQRAAWGSPASREVAASTTTAARARAVPSASVASPRPTVTVIRRTSTPRRTPSPKPAAPYHARAPTATLPPARSSERATSGLAEASPQQVQPAPSSPGAHPGAVADSEGDDRATQESPATTSDAHSNSFVDSHGPPEPSPYAHDVGSETAVPQTPPSPQCAWSPPAAGSESRTPSLHFPVNAAVPPSESDGRSESTVSEAPKVGWLQQSRNESGLLPVWHKRQSVTDASEGGRVGMIVQHLARHDSSSYAGSSLPATPQGRPLGDTLRSSVGSIQRHASAGVDRSDLRAGTDLRRNASLQRSTSVNSSSSRQRLFERLHSESEQMASRKESEQARMQRMASRNAYDTTHYQQRRVRVEPLDEENPMMGLTAHDITAAAGLAWSRHRQKRLYAEETCPSRNGCVKTVFAEDGSVLFDNPSLKAVYTSALSHPEDMLRPCANVMIEFDDGTSEEWPPALVLFMCALAAKATRDTVARLSARKVPYVAAERRQPSLAERMDGIHGEASPFRDVQSAHLHTTAAQRCREESTAARKRDLKKVEGLGRGGYEFAANPKSIRQPSTHIPKGVPGYQAALAAAAAATLEAQKAAAASPAVVARSDVALVPNPVQEDTPAAMSTPPHPPAVVGRSPSTAGEDEPTPAAAWGAGCEASTDDDDASSAAAGHAIVSAFTPQAQRQNAGDTTRFRLSALRGAEAPSAWLASNAADEAASLPSAQETAPTPIQGPDGVPGDTRDGTAPAPDAAVEQPPCDGASDGAGVQPVASDAQPGGAGVPRSPLSDGETASVTFETVGQREGGGSPGSVVPRAGSDEVGDGEVHPQLASTADAAATMGSTSGEGSQ